MIRIAEQQDIVKLHRLAEQFYSASAHLEGFSLYLFCENWSKIIAGPGVIFLSTSGNEIYGALGGVAYPDINSGQLQAVEFFWWVDPAHRGSGVRLYEAFEKWAIEQGCTTMRMIALADSMPESLDNFYRRKGFQRTEVHYAKKLWCNRDQE